MNAEGDTEIHVLEKQALTNRATPVQQLLMAKDQSLAMTGSMEILFMLELCICSLFCDTSKGPFSFDYPLT